MKFFSSILIVFIAYLFVGSVNASSCSFKTQLKYQDGSVGCVEDLSISNSVFFGDDRKIIDVINKATMYAIAQSKTAECKSASIASLIPGNISVSRFTALPTLSQKAVDLCMNQGCDCELVIADGDVLVDKESMLSGRSLAPSSQSIANQVNTDEKQIQQEQIKKAQLEKDQKELVAKVKLDKEKSLAEEKRIQAEIAKNNQDKLLAEKVRIEQEKRVAEEAQAQIQLAKLQAQEKEKANAIARLQQDKDNKENALSAQKNEEERIVSLRKELEKEIRASIQKETNSSQAQASNPNKAAPTVYANRKALVIGNDSYGKVAPLVNAREDARVMAESLTSLGFNVSMKLDVTQKQFLSELRNFKNQVKAGDEVALFYAGHGVQIASTNYLLPIDIQGQSEEEVRDDAISLQRLLDDMDEKKVKFTLAVIDACRDNPFKGATRSALGTRGLAPTTAATGQMIVFSAGTGQQALDKVGPNDKSKNGLFTRIFVKEMQKEGLTVDRVVRNVRTEVVAVAKSVGHNQVPAIYDQVVGEFYFKQ